MGYLKLVSFWGFISWCLSGCKGAQITDINPRAGGRGGEIRLSIYGSGFSADQFSVNNDPNVGNHVFLVSNNGKQYNCSVLSYASDVGRIVCITPGGMQEEDHHVIVVVDGKLAQKSCWLSCMYTPRNDYTPYISTVTSQSGMPGNMITITGTLFTDRYGSQLATASNGRTESIMRVLFGPQNCDLETDEVPRTLYGLYVYRTWNWWNYGNYDSGTLTCKLKGTSVGFYNASFIVDSPFGRSLVQPALYRVSNNDQLYIYQQYTDITNISAHFGSVAGGLSLRIYGHYFDDRVPYTKPKAYIGETTCEIKSVVPDSHIECIVAPAPNISSSQYAGNRGVNLEYWTNLKATISDNNGFLNLTDKVQGYHFETLDETRFTIHTRWQYFASKINTFYNPPHTGDYQIFLESTGKAQLFFDGEPLTSFDFQSFLKETKRLHLDKDRRYLLQILQTDFSDTHAVHVKIKFFNTTFTSSSTPFAEQEQQTIRITSSTCYEIQELVFNTLRWMEAVYEVQRLELTKPIQFRLGLFGIYTEPISIQTPTERIKAALLELPIWAANEYVMVDKNQTEQYIRFTFVSNRGDFPNLDVIAVDSMVPINCKIIEEIRGIPDRDTVALKLESRISDVFSVSRLDAKQLEALVKDMLYRAKCPVTFRKDAAYYEDFETSGSSGSDREPFCGKAVLENPTVLYYDQVGKIGLFYNRMLCFGYKGMFENKLTIEFSFYDSSFSLKAMSVTVGNVFTYMSSDEWRYICVDMYQIVFDKSPDGVNHILNKVYLTKSSGSSKWFVDSVYIGSAPTTTDKGAHLRRIAPLVQIAAKINTISVIMRSKNVYEVTLVPIPGNNRFPLFELVNGKPENPTIVGTTSTTPTITSIPVTQLKLNTFSNTVSSSVVSVLTTDEILTTGYAASTSLTETKDSKEVISDTTVTSESKGNTSIPFVGKTSSSTSDTDSSTVTMNSTLTSDAGSSTVTMNSTVMSDTDSSTVTMNSTVMSDTDSSTVTMNSTITSDTDSSTVTMNSTVMSDTDSSTVTMNSTITSDTDSSTVTMNSTRTSDTDVSTVTMNSTITSDTDLSTVTMNSTITSDTDSSTVTMNSTITSDTDSSTVTMNSTITSDTDSSTVTMNLTITSDTYLSTVTMNSTITSDTDSESSTVTMNSTIMSDTDSSTVTVNSTITSDTDSSTVTMNSTITSDTDSSTVTIDSSRRPDTDSSTVTKDLTITSDTSLSTVTMNSTRTSDTDLSTVTMDSSVTSDTYSSTMDSTITSDTDSSTMGSTITSTNGTTSYYASTTSWIETEDTTISDFTTESELTTFSFFNGTITENARNGNLQQLGETNSSSENPLTALTTASTQSPSEAMASVSEIFDSYSRNNASFILNNSGGLVFLNVTRISTASLPVAGNIDITIYGKTRTGVNIALSGVDFKKELEFIEGIGDLNILRKGDSANIEFVISFLTLPGDIPEMTVNDSMLIGTNAKARVITKRDGGLFYDPLTGDSLTTVHEVPQVRLFINDVPTKCTGDCSFVWNLEATPALISISSHSGPALLNRTVEITGTGFSENQEDNILTIGVPCNVSYASSTVLKCTLGQGPIGNQVVNMLVKGKGFAVGDLLFTYTSEIVSVNPDSGSLGGGTILTIAGYGFRNDTLVSINNMTCDIISKRIDRLLCSTPASETDGSFDVVVFSSGSTLQYSSYRYYWSKTAKVTSVLPSVIKVTGGEVTISGSFQFRDKPRVNVGELQAKVLMWSDDKVSIVTEELDVGEQPIKILLNEGYAVNVSSSSLTFPTINVDLVITDVYPHYGSLFGGTVLTITGSGFGTNVSEVKTTVGDVGCSISSMTDVEIICQIGSTSQTQFITNKGIHPAFGVFYAFDKPVITISEGDIVQWSWETPAFVNGIAHAIIEIDSPQSTIPKDGGFKSGTPTRNGNYTYQFRRIGTFYIWSGFVDVWNIKNYVGTINVVKRNSSSEIVNVNVKKALAVHKLQGLKHTENSADCQAYLKIKHNCTDVIPTDETLGKYLFTFWSCATPMVTSINVRNATTKTEIQIRGEGFADSVCQNLIMVGQSTCIVTEAKVSFIACNIAKLGNPKIGGINQIEMRVFNLGFAYQNTSNGDYPGVVLLPNIENISPLVGSIAGGTLLTISGFGYGEYLKVNLGGIECPIVTSTFSEIICETPSYEPNVVPVELFVYLNRSQFKAKCETFTKNCDFTYDKLVTPFAIGITPDQMSSKTFFNISGNGFGNYIEMLKVTFGNSVAEVIESSDTHILVTVDNIAVGYNEVKVRLYNQGYANGSLYVYGVPVIASVIPARGSIYGQTEVSIIGHGFIENKTKVMLDGYQCNITKVSLSQIVFITNCHAQKTVDLIITSNGIQYPSVKFQYDESVSPRITSIRPVAGLTGDSVTIIGTGLQNENITVMIGESQCSLEAKNYDSITCTLGQHKTGLVNVSVYSATYGASNNDIQFEYMLVVHNVTPSTGGIGGGQTISLSGFGFENSAIVHICEQICDFLSTTSSRYTCKTPTHTVEMMCDVSISLANLTKMLNNSYTYAKELSPSISNVSPRRGGTAGGTKLTITGKGFGNDVENVIIRISGVDCNVTKVTNTQVECITGPSGKSAKAKVDVEVSQIGKTIEEAPNSADFYYIDVWSSVYTWGGESIPQEGEFIVIPQGLTLLLDQSTPLLMFLLIKGGVLIFDEQDIELNAEMIMITDGGVLKVGTESEPFQHKATITLHGHARSVELPIYGAKVLAIRNGTLDLHGVNVPLIWTRLSATANQGESIVYLTQAVHWKVGDEIVIATTGHRHSQRENEKRTILEVAEDGLALKLNSPLNFNHSGVEEIFDGTVVEFRAEVGLLSHNVVVRGNEDPQWEDKIEKCDAGYDTGQFAIQTCFLGRFGEEIGSSQFGATIFVHTPKYNSKDVTVRISNTEITFAGQAYRTGRNPVNFHLNGDMSGSFIKRCSLHRTFNRAINIQGSNNILIDNSVLYDIQGSAVFLEDGVEMGNILQYNLVVFVIGSTSLLNHDISPASFWMTNPNNTLQHNAVAGGSHFGYWYRLQFNIDGASPKNGICNPDTTPIGVFRNNSAHSFGWYGLWIYEGYYPNVLCGTPSANLTAAIFERLFAWNNDKGVEIVNFGAVQVVNSTLVQNRLSGYEGFSIPCYTSYTENSPMIKNSLIIGTTSVIQSREQGCTKNGVVLPYGVGFMVSNVRFVNFLSNDCKALETRIFQRCTFYCDTEYYRFEKIAFFNVTKRGIEEYGIRWIIDRDGSVTGKSEMFTLIPKYEIIDVDCEDAPLLSVGVPISICPSKYILHLLAITDLEPQYLRYTNLIVSSDNQNSSIPFLSNTGWKFAVLANKTYVLQFRAAESLANLSFTLLYVDLEPGDFLIFKLNLSEFPDRFSFGGPITNATEGNLNISSARTGDWQWNALTKEITFLLKPSQNRRDNCSPYTSIRFMCFKCYFADCIPPPTTAPPVTVARPPGIFYWHDVTIWKYTDDGYISDVGSNGTIVPADGDNVRVLLGTWVIVNMTAIAKLRCLLVEGILEFADFQTAVYNIEADHIVIRGGRLVIGWPHDPFDGIATISLHGNDSTAYCEPGQGPILGSRAMGVFGGLDLFGKDIGTSWTRLAQTVNAGSFKIKLEEPVTWRPGDDIVIGGTSFGQAEVFKIANVESDNMTINLNTSVRYRYIVHSEILPGGRVVKLAAPVGLLSRNIRIVNGSRILVGFVIHDQRPYRGFARLSNVEFDHTGQQGYEWEYDPRYSLTYMNVGAVLSDKPSSVKSCSFHDGFNSAVGAFGIQGLEISNNILFQNNGYGIRTRSSDSRLLNNLIVKQRDAGIQGRGSSMLTMRDNLVVTSSNGLADVPALCNSGNTSRYNNNQLYANNNGAIFTSDECQDSNGFAYIGDLISWKNLQYGIYYQGTSSVIVQNTFLIENRIGFYATITGPSPVYHLYADQRILIQKTTFIGQISSTNCTLEMAKNGDVFSGIVFPRFSSDSLFAIGGLTTLKDVTFANYFNSECKRIYAITADPTNNVFQHQIVSENATLIGTSHENKIKYYRPNVELIIPYACVDMDCDGLKKVLFKDLDGTFLGHVGAVIPQSEFEWNGDPRRGLGDYRIPKEMVTMTNGTRIPYSVFAPYKGIIRNDNCSYRDSWQAYECNKELNYQILVIESMDIDSETRRISPVAILGDRHIDLINGPPFHSWCTGYMYSCKLRLSTFVAVVATGKEYLLHFTGTTPKDLRYRMLNAPENEGIRLTVWYSRSNRLDVYVNGKLIPATNSRTAPNGRYVLSLPTGGEYNPSISNETGTNFFNRSRGELTIIIKGPTEINVKTQNTIIFTFAIPEITVEEFYGLNIIENLAYFLGVPLNKVRILTIVSESDSRRQKRSLSGVIVEVEIGDQPVEAINGTVDDSIDYSNLTDFAATLLTECQLGNIASALNYSLACITVEVPSDDVNTGSMVYETQQINHLYFVDVPAINYEGVPFKLQPKLRMADIFNNPVTSLVTVESPWKILVSLRNGTGDPEGVLSGDQLVNSSSGWFNFTDLQISLMGSGYILDFAVIYPTMAKNFTISSDPLDVPGRPLKLSVYNQTYEVVYTNETFTVTMELQDLTTDEVIKNISWRNHHWTADINLLEKSKYGHLSDTHMTEVDVNTGHILFRNLSFIGFGVFYLQIGVESDPAEYNLTFSYKQVVLRLSDPTNNDSKTEHNVKVKVLENVDKLLLRVNGLHMFEQMILTEFANMWPDVELVSGELNENTIVAFTISGLAENVNSTMFSLCEMIQNKTYFTYSGRNFTLAPYLTVDDVVYYGVLCGETDTRKAIVQGGNNALPIYVYILVISGVVLVLCIAIAFIVWKCTRGTKIKKNNPAINSQSSIKNTSSQYLRNCASSVVLQTPCNIKFRPYENTKKTFGFLDDSTINEPLEIQDDTVEFSRFGLPRSTPEQTYRRKPTRKLLPSSGSEMSIEVLYRLTPSLIDIDLPGHCPEKPEAAKDAVKTTTAHKNTLVF